MWKLSLSISVLTLCPRLFLVFVTKISELRFLRTLPKTVNSTTSTASAGFSGDDELDLGLYYIRTLSNVLRWAPDALWGVLATRIIEGSKQTLSEISEFSRATIDIIFN